MSKFLSETFNIDNLERSCSSVKQTPLDEILRLALSLMNIQIAMFTLLKRFSIHGMMEEEGNVLKPHQEIAALSLEEKRFLLAVERGDVASSRR